MASPVTSDGDLYNELAYYTLSHSDPAFIHQHVVDAFTAQHADEKTKPIAVVFALIGLYLYIEKNFTGRQVQMIHMRIAKSRRAWPSLTPPQERGAITIRNVLDAPPGREREQVIRNWCASVWAAWKESRNPIRNLLKTLVGIS